MADVAPSNLSQGNAERLIREIVQDSIRVFLPGHTKKRMLERGVSSRQVFTCLEKGAVTEGPFINGHGNWQVTLTRFAAGHGLKVAVAIEWPDELVIVTVI